MGLAVLPLHVWDREIDSRIFLAAILLSEGHQVVFGHEYNISPLYQRFPQLFHIGAGRPVYNEPRTNLWYEPIIKNGGFNGLIFEEGINDIMLNSSISFPGINSRSVNSTSKIFAWCQREVDQMCDAAPDDLHPLLRAKSSSCSNSRIDLLGPIGSDYFEQYTNSIQQIFGDYILISDNFGLEIFGVGAPLDTRPEFKWVSETNKKEELIEFNQNYHQKGLRSRDQFTKTINTLVKSFPSINFIFRPHPVADPFYWHKNLVKSRNINIICRDSPVPWIKASKAVIHSGCTLGLESELTNIPAIDISRVYGDIRKQSVSNIVSRYKPDSMDQLQKCVQKSWLSQVFSNKPCHTENSHLDNVLQNNMQHINDDVFNLFNSFKLGFPKLSNLSYTLSVIRDFYSSTDLKFSQSYSAQLITSFVGDSRPLAGKSRYYSVTEITRRLISANKALQLNTKIKVQKISKNNVFLFTPS